MDMAHDFRSTPLSHPLMTVILKRKGVGHVTRFHRIESVSFIKGFRIIHMTYVMKEQKLGIIKCTSPK